MDIVCLDMEGTLTPEIWEQVSIDSGIPEFNKTTRDIPSYTELMDYRIEIMKQYDLKLTDIINAAKKLDLLDGALNFLNEVRKEFQVVILSDTFHEIAYPLMEKLGYPLLLCHKLDTDKEDNIIGKIHVSELSVENVNDARSLVKIDEELEAKIISIDKKTRLISLSIKAKEEQDEKIALDSYQSDSSAVSSGSTTLGELLKEKMEDK